MSETNEARSHSKGSTRRKKIRPAAKPANGPVTVTRVNPLALSVARLLAADPANTRNHVSIENGQVFVR